MSNKYKYNRVNEDNYLMVFLVLCVSSPIIVILLALLKVILGINLSVLIIPLALSFPLVFIVWGLHIALYSVLDKIVRSSHE